MANGTGNRILERQLRGFLEPVVDPLRPKWGGSPTATDIPADFLPAIPAEFAHGASDEFQELLRRALREGVDSLEPDDQRRLKAAMEQFPELAETFRRRGEQEKQIPKTPEQNFAKRTEQYFSEAIPAVPGATGRAVIRTMADFVSEVSSPLIQYLEERKAATPHPVSPSRDFNEEPLTIAEENYQRLSGPDKMLAWSDFIAASTTSSLLSFFTQSLDQIVNPEKHQTTTSEALGEIAGGLTDMIAQAPDQLSHIAEAIYGTRDNPVSKLTELSGTILQAPKLVLDGKDREQLRKEAVNNFYAHPEGLPFAVMIVKGVYNKSTKGLRKPFDRLTEEVKPAEIKPSFVERAREELTRRREWEREIGAKKVEIEPASEAAMRAELTEQAKMAEGVGVEFFPKEDIARMTRPELEYYTGRAKEAPIKEVVRAKEEVPIQRVKGKEAAKTPEAVAKELGLEYRGLIDVGVKKTPEGKPILDAEGYPQTQKGYEFRLTEKGRETDITVEYLADLPAKLEAKRAEYAAAKKPVVEKVPAMKLPRKVVEIPKEFEPKPGKTISPADVSRHFQQSLQVPIRIGKMRGYSEALGIYKKKAEVVRLKDPSDLSVISHEVAHHIDKKFDVGKITKRDRELAGLDYDPKLRRTREGFAEYVRMWLTESDNVAVRAPKFTKKFDKFLEQNPELRTKLEQGREMIRRWREQGAEERVYAQIDMQGRGTPGSIIEKVGRGIRRIGTLFVDDLIPLEYAERQMRGVKKLDPSKIDPATSPTMIARVEVRKAPAKTHDMILEGTFDWGGKHTGMSLRDALAPVSKEIREFTTYAYARRGLELHGRGVNPGIDLADAQYVVSKLKSPKFDRAFDEVVHFQDRVLQYAVDAGVLSKEAATTIRDLNQAYIPLKRVFEEGSGFGYSGGKKIADLPQPIKRIRGSGRQILNPWHSIIQSTSEIIATADKVRIGSALIELSKKTEGAGKWVEKVDAPKQVISRALKDMEKQLKDAGVDLSRADMDAVVTLYANSPKYLGKENIVSFWKEGKREFYQLEPDLYRAIMNSDRMAMPWIVNQVMGAPARAVRLGATGLQAGFSWITNPIRDAQAFALQTEFSTGLPHEVAKGLYRRAKPGDPYTRLWKRSGGDFSIHIGFDRRYLKSAQQSVLASDKLRKMYNVARHPIEIAREALSFSEAAPRIAEFEAAYKKGEKLYGKESASARLMATGAASEVTINFGRMGAYGKYINQIIPFWNAGIQGWSKMYRFGKEHPVKAGIRATAFISAPTFGLWWMHKDERWYQDLPAWRKYGFWNFHIGQNKDGSNRILSLPRPFDWGIVFGSVPEMMLNYWYEKDKKAMVEALTAIGEQAAPDYIPASLRPIIEWSANYDFFLDRAIDPYYEVRYKDPEYRYTEYTPETAKWLGKQLGLSPRKINHLISSATGGLGEDVIRGSETFKQFLEEEMIEIEHPADIPIAGRLFHREPPPDKKIEWLFFQTKDERQKIITMIKEGDTEKAMRRLKEWNRTHPLAPIKIDGKKQ